jgi:hypothetical protein
MEVNSVMELSFGQRIDPQNGLVECWFTHPALDEIKGMDLSQKTVWMYGAGKGDIWLAKRCKELIVVERDEKWLSECMAKLREHNQTNLTYIHRPCDDCAGMDEMYCEIPEKYEVDVIIVDDAYRYECIVKAIEYSKTRFQGIVLIIDNWMQSYVFMCPAAEEALKLYQQVSYEQVDHEHHDGVNKWKTLIAYL